VDADGRLAGIVSRTDVLAVYARPDIEIAEEGVATLTGRPQTCQQGHDIVFRVRHVQGVVAVRDRLDYPAPGPDVFDVLARFPMD
jgi:CBS domain-containing protein